MKSTSAQRGTSPRLRASAQILVFLSATVFAAPALAQTIVIDPGHGGGDPGGTGSSLEEKHIVLETSQRFFDLLESDTADTTGGGSWTPHLTRDTDQFIELAARSAYANSLDADRFLSVHANAFGTASANGTETFSYSATGTGADLRDLVQEEMIGAWQLTNRGSKVASFSVLRNTAMPAELHELGFLTNSVDAAKLGDPDARQDAAVAHLHALQRHYGLSPHTPTVPPQPLPPAPPPSSIDIFVADKSGVVPEARIFLDGLEAGYTDAQGFLRIDALLAAKFSIIARTGDHTPLHTALEVRAGEAAAVHLQLDKVPEEERPVLAPQEQPTATDNNEMPSAGCSSIGRSGTRRSGGTTSVGALMLLALLAVERRRRNQ